MEPLFRVLRQSFRRLKKNRGANFVAVLTMALGIGLTASMYTLIDVMMFQGVPFEDADSLVHLGSTQLEDGVQRSRVSQHDFEAWVDQQTAFEGLAGLHVGTMNLSDDAALPERYSGAWISTNFLELLGERPVLGRGFEPADAEPGAAQVVLISHQVWQQRYGSNPAVIGQRASLNSKPATIIGVLPSEFRFPEIEDVWAPLEQRAMGHPRGSAELPELTVFGRLKSGSTLEEAATQMAGIGRRLEQGLPQTHQGRGVFVERYNERYADEESLQLFGVMFGAVLLVLLIACFNVANLMIGRASLRSRDFAVQAALGSPKHSAVVQILTESLLLAVPGALLGLGFAHLAISFFDRAISAMGLPFWMDFHLNSTVFLVTAGATLVAALVSGLAPAIQASRFDMQEVLSDASRGSTSFRIGRLSRAMVVVQVAASTALCIGAGMAVRGVQAAQSFEHAFETENLLSARVGLPEKDYPEASDRVTFFEALERRLAGEAGLEAVTISTVLPAENNIGGGNLQYERPGEVYDRPGQMPFTRVVQASPSYFATLGTQVLIGRDFSPADHQEMPAVVIVNESFAGSEWPGQNPLGQHLDFWLGAEEEAGGQAVGRVEVIGVAPDLHFGGFGKSHNQGGVYFPLAQRPAAFAWVIARTRGNPALASRPLRRAVLDLDPNLPLYNVHTMEQVLDRSLFGPRFFGSLFGAFGLAALFMACIGLYGLMAFAVSQRSQEMGVRMALGAKARDILRLVLGQGLRQTALGLVLGMILGQGLTLVLASQIFQAKSSDPVLFAVVPAILTMAALLACWSPARRAAGVDPIRALRRD